MRAHLLGIEDASLISSHDKGDFRTSVGVWVIVIRQGDRIGNVGCLGVDKHDAPSKGWRETKDNNVLVPNVVVGDDRDLLEDLCVVAKTLYHRDELEGDINNVDEILELGKELIEGLWCLWEVQTEFVGLVIVKRDRECESRDKSRTLMGEQIAKLCVAQDSFVPVVFSRGCDNLDHDRGSMMCFCLVQLAALTFFDG